MVQPGAELKSPPEADSKLMAMSEKRVGHTAISGSHASSTPYCLHVSEQGCATTAYADQVGPMHLHAGHLKHVFCPVGLKRLIGIGKRIDIEHVGTTTEG